MDRREKPFSAKGFSRTLFPKPLGCRLLAAIVTTQPGAAVLHGLQKQGGVSTQMTSMGSPSIPFQEWGTWAG